MLQEEAADLGQEAFTPDLRKINAAGGHLLELINAVLDLSKIEAGRMELFLETFGVAEMVEDIAAVIGPLAARNRNRLEVRCEPAVGRMHADLTKVRQALFNLLSNACKFTEAGTVALAVAREAVDGGDWLSFAVSDTGIGMTGEQMLTIVDDRNLGYALGAAEYLTKPIDRERLVAVLRRYRRDLPVLVVDDDPTLRELLRRTLEAKGYAVAEAGNGREALGKLRETTPGVILLDRMMPEMDGFEFLEELRRDEAGRALPVIVITAKDLSADERERLNGRVARVLQKGAYTREALLTEVRELVNASLKR
jgi:CheY-like chemotaxis protein